MSARRSDPSQRHIVCAHPAQLRGALDSIRARLAWAEEMQTGRRAYDASYLRRVERRLLDDLTDIRAAIKALGNERSNTAAVRRALEQTTSLERAVGALRSGRARTWVPRPPTTPRALKGPHPTGTALFPRRGLLPAYSGPSSANHYMDPTSSK